LRTIELFRAKSTEFFGVVARFHLPCVRAYYQGNNVYILPSCITAMMTGINIDYKYFAGVRDPIDIINKYRMRGFGVILTDHEKKHMAYYNNNIKTFGGMFHVPSNDKTAIQKMFGAKELDDQIYRPLCHIDGLPQDTYNNYPTRYIKNMSDLKKYYADKYKYNAEIFGFDLFKFTSIRRNGFVAQYQPWVSKAYLDISSQGR
jgi:hypothetical protein